MSDSTRDKLMSLLSRHDEEHSHEYVVWINDFVFEQADVSGENVERVTRCRDCKRFHTNTNGLDCPKLEPNGFCKWGERRDA